MNTVIRTIAACAIAAALATACSREDPHAGHDHGPGGHQHEGAADPGTGGEDHGEAMDLGTVEILGHEFTVARFGAVEAGKECAFEVGAVGDAAGLSPFLWVENADGEQVGGPENGSLEDGRLHYHVTPRADGGEPVRVVLRLRHDGKDERAGLPLDGHGHEHR